MRPCCQRLRVLLLLRLAQVLTSQPTWWAMGEHCRRCGHRVVLRWRLDEATLKPVGKAGSHTQWPKELGRNEHPMKGMRVRSASDVGADPASGVSCDGFIYRARWESLPANRDRPQPGGVPPPAMLRVYKMKVRQS